VGACGSARCDTGTPDGSCWDLLWLIVKYGNSMPYWGQWDAEDAFLFSLQRLEPAAGLLPSSARIPAARAPKATIRRGVQLLQSS
jgi:hypothetical protein